MDKKQKRMLLSVLIILLILCVVLGYTFAKYYSMYEGKANQKIAKWNFKVNNWEASPTETINLLDTTTNGQVIAPGSEGNFEIDIDASGSEVDVRYSIVATQTGNIPENMRFYVQKEGSSTKNGPYSDFQTMVNEQMTNTIAKSDTNKKANFVVYWEWPYDSGNDEADNKAGQLANSGMVDYTLTLQVIGTQVNSTI